MRTVELPSGRKIEVKRPGAMAMMYSGMLAGKIEGNGETSMEIQLIQARVVCSCTVNPRVTVEYPAPKGDLYFDDLEVVDWIKLVEVVSEMVEEVSNELSPLSKTEEAATP